MDNMNDMMPDNAVAIEEYAFFGRNDIEKLIIPESVRTIGNGAFSGCRALKEIVLPKAVESIGDGAFFGCSSLRQINIPSSVASIGEHAFSSCSSLEKITLPSGIRELGKGLFQGCGSLREICTEDEGNLVSIDGVLFTARPDGMILLVFPMGRTGDYRIPAGTVRIADGAFRGCTGLDKVVISEDVSMIGDRALQDVQIYSLR